MIIFLNRLPVPNLKHYCVVSCSFLLCVTIYAQKIFYDLYNENFDEEYNSEFVISTGYFLTICHKIINEPWCIWVLINFCYCGLLIFSEVIQGIIFGKLRAVEIQHIKDQFWNFIFLKFIFIFGVLNLENLDDVIKWCTWFSLIGFLSIHSQICKDRFEYLSFSTSTPSKSHFKVLSLLAFIQIACVFLLVAPFVAKSNEISTVVFLFAESLALFLRTLYVISKYAIHLCEINNWVQIKRKSTIIYYVDFCFEISVVTLDFLHYLHMLIYGNFYLSMASLVICMELKRLFMELKRRLRRHSNYLRVLEKMEKKFPWASSEELIETDKCPVCWEELDEARRLPCSHIFHQNCLRSWLEQDTSCPTCRKPLNDEKETQQQQHTTTPAFAGGTTTTDSPTNPGQPATNGIQQIPQLQQQIIQRNLFHFDGSRYFSWLPSFSLQVTNGAGVLPGLLRQRQPLSTELLNEMTAQVSQMFSHIPVELIQQDLQQTHSVELTIENILEDRISQATNLPNERQANANGDNTRNSDNEDGDEYDENTSSEEESSNEGSNNNNIFSNLLNFSDVSVNPSGLVENSSQNSGDNIMIRYKEDPDLSEKANSLIQRKRELILNSKKRFLERNNVSTESNVPDTPNSEKTVDSEHLRRRPIDQTSSQD